MKTISVFLLLFVFNVSFSQTKSYEKGEIINSINVKGTNDETFQLYLPLTYNPKNLSAIVFIFDPSGNGTKGIKPFIKSSERFNYILVCSNNTKNGPYQQNFDITNRLFSHVFSNFSIDEKQIYTAGFSGGSRLACTVAVLTGAIQGVIACGAGFPNEKDKKPSSGSKFSYVGLVGNEDMNYQEMILAKDWLDKFNVDNELYTFEDGHHWPSQIQIERAFKWLELQAYKRELRAPNLNLIKEFYAEDLAIADSVVQNLPYRAILDYERIIRNYSKYENIEQVSERKRAIKNSKQYKDELKIRKKVKEEEQKIASKLLSRLHQESISGESRDNFAWWRKELRQLEEKYLKSDDYFMKKMGKRIQFRIKATAYEGSMFQRTGKRLDIAIYCDKLLVQIHPDEPYWNYRLAETHAINNDAKSMRQNLQLAVEKGFKNHELITKNPVFLKFRGDKKFDVFIARLKAN